MKSKRNKPTKGQKLWALYELELGKSISYATWKRRLSEIKRLDNSFSLRNKNASKTVTHYAKIRRQHGRLAGRGDNHEERMRAFEYIRRLKRDLKGMQFLQLLSNYLQINLDSVSQSNFYYWFSRVGLSFNANKLYKNDDLCFVAYVAAIWAINRRSGNIKPNSIVNKLSIGRCD